MKLGFGYTSLPSLCRQVAIEGAIAFRLLFVYCVYVRILIDFIVFVCFSDRFDLWLSARLSNGMKP